MTPTHAAPLGRFDSAEDDSWDLASSVGVTATVVAAGRTLATKDSRGLIDDPLAERLVCRVGMKFFTKLLDGELEPAAADDHALARLPSMIDEMALRTKFFDEAFLAAGAVGIRQAVILASGLDARAYRLAWPAGRTVVYEIDQPHVIDFTTDTLAGIGVEPTTERRAVSIDLREDWPAALRSAGFDPASPTAWSAEGLLPFLPSEAQDRLFGNITDLSAPGSTIATDYVPGLQDFDEEKARAMTALCREYGHDLDLFSSWYTGERSHVIEYLTAAGWQASGLTVDEQFVRNGIERISVNDDDSFANLTYVSATLNS